MKKAKQNKQVHPIFLANDVVEAVRNVAAREKRTMKATTEILIREALDARAKAVVQ